MTENDRSPISPSTAPTAPSTTADQSGISRPSVWFIIKAAISTRTAPPTTPPTAPPIIS